MTAEVRRILDQFNRLSPEDQQEVARAILKQTRDLDSPPLTDDDLTRLADERFSKLDLEDLRWRLSTFKEDWSRPEMDVYDEI